LLEALLLLLLPFNAAAIASLTSVLAGVVSRNWCAVCIAERGRWGGD